MDQEKAMRAGELCPNCSQMGPWDGCKICYGTGLVCEPMDGGENTVDEGARTNRLDKALEAKAILEGNDIVEKAARKAKAAGDQSTVGFFGGDPRDSMKEQGTPNDRRDVALFAYLEENKQLAGVGAFVAGWDAQATRLADLSRENEKLRDALGAAEDMTEDCPCGCGMGVMALRLGVEKG